MRDVIRRTEGTDCRSSVLEGDAYAVYATVEAHGQRSVCATRRSDLRHLSASVRNATEQVSGKYKIQNTTGKYRIQREARGVGSFSGGLDATENAEYKIQNTECRQSPQSENVRQQKGRHRAICVENACILAITHAWRLSTMCNDKKENAECRKWTHEE